MNKLRPNRPCLRVESLEPRTLLTAGTLDPTFGTGGIASVRFTGSLNDTANAATTQSDGKLIVVGGSNGDFSLARYNLDGSLDVTFGAAGRVITDFQGGFDQANAVAVGPDGKIVVAGFSIPSVVSGPSRFFAVARFNSDGSLDASFGTGGEVLTSPPVNGGREGTVNAVIIQPNDKIVAASMVTSFTSQTNTEAVLVRYNLDGSLDATFGAGGVVRASQSGAVDLVRQPDGKLIALADFSQQLLRFNENGTPDTSFGASGVVNLMIGPTFDSGVASKASGLALQADGKYVVLGTAINNPTSSQRDFVLVRVNTDGTFDATFGTGGKAVATLATPETSNRVVIQADGKIFAGGVAGFATNNQFLMARFNSDGTLDNSFGSGGKVLVPTSVVSGPANGLTLQNGQAVQVGTDSKDSVVLRLTTSGNLDPTFGANGIVRTDFQGPVAGTPANIALQADGKIVEVGSRPGSNGNDFAIVRFNANGSLDTTFGTNGRIITDFGGNDGATRALIQPDGKIVVVGTTTPSSASGAAYLLARYNSDGSLDPSFGSGGKLITQTNVNSPSQAAALQVDPVTSAVKIVADRNGSLIRLNPDGSLDVTFGTAGTAPEHPLRGVAQVTMQADGKIVEVGDDSVAVFSVARYMFNGLLDQTFGSNGLARVPSPPTADPTFSFGFDAAVQPDGKIVATGEFKLRSDLAVGTFFVLALVRLNADGSLDQSFGAGGVEATGTTPQVGVALTLQPDGKIVLVVQAFNGTSTLQRFNADGVPDGTFGPGVSAQAPQGISRFVDVQMQGDKIIAGGNGPGQVDGDFFVARYLTQASANERYVAQLYQDLLHRPGDKTGMMSFPAQLDQGITRNTVATVFTQSGEYRQALVKSFYLGFLHRSADTPGLNANISFLTNGATTEQVKARFIGSDEYFQTRAQGDNDRFLDALYSDILGRPVDAGGRQTFKQALAAGATRAAVALAVLTSREAYQDLVGALYVLLLRRSADQGGLDTFTNALQRGVRSEAVIAALAASDEYFSKV